MRVAQSCDGGGGSGGGRYHQYLCRSGTPGLKQSAMSFPGKSLTLTHCHEAVPSEPLLSVHLSFSAFTLMFHTQSAATSSSNFQPIFVNALNTYRKRTKKDLLAHPLVTELHACRTPAAILDILQRQVQGPDRSRHSDERWLRWLDPTVNVLFSSSVTIAASAGLVCLKTCAHLRSAFSYSFGRYSLPRV